MAIEGNFRRQRHIRRNEYYSLIKFSDYHRLICLNDNVEKKCETDFSASHFFLRISNLGN
jgi:hypothetical protein